MKKPKELGKFRPKEGATPRAIDITGWLFGVWDSLLERQNGTPVIPVMINIEDTDYLAIFETPEQLREVYDALGYDGYSIKQIQDGQEFLASLPAHIPVLGNPRQTDDGWVRGTLVELI